MSAEMSALLLGVAIGLIAGLEIARRAYKNTTAMLVEDMRLMNAYREAFFEARPSDGDAVDHMVGKGE